MVGSDIARPDDPDIQVHNVLPSLLSARQTIQLSARISRRTLAIGTFVPSFSIPAGATGPSSRDRNTLYPAGKGPRLVRRPPIKPDRPVLPPEIPHCHVGGIVGIGEQPDRRSSRSYPSEVRRPRLCAFSLAAAACLVSTACLQPCYYIVDVDLSCGQSRPAGCRICNGWITPG